ncbi:MAG: hypothetical protein H5T99_07355, partial [Moorella sp. (in: Bacteria)]|nr:hypothetical protein [Moorella sp. (in: firmicutes)]
MSVEAIIEAPGARELVRARKSRSPGERGDFAAYFADLLQRPRQIAVDKEKPLPPEERADLQGMTGCRGEKEATGPAGQEQRPSSPDPGGSQVEGTARQDLPGGMGCGAKG